MPKPIPHPILIPPLAKQFFAQAKDMADGERLWQAAQNKRMEIIRQEEADPLRYGWEPHIWQVCRAILGLQCYNNAFLRQVQKRLNMNWDQFAAAMRKHLGFEKPVSVLLILGGNRSSKSEFQSKTASELLHYNNDQTVYAVHETDAQSVDLQQRTFWRFMPPEWKVKVQSQTTYIAFKAKTGFSEGGFINPRGSQCFFRNYSQELKNVFPGTEPNFIVAEEQCPAEWLPEMMARLVTRAGKMLYAFTPIDGYTAMVKAFLDCAKPVKESIGYLLPLDKERADEDDEARSLNLTLEEYREIRAAEAEKRAAQAPASRVEDCIAWLEGGPSQIPPEAGRKYQLVHRVMKCVDPAKAVVFFQTSDNPYGNPKGIIDLRCKNVARDEVRMRFYGIAAKSMSSMFVAFNEKVHVIPAAAVPAVGTNHMLMDPAADRNFAMAWVRASGDTHYGYREWPGNYHIPTIGIPGPWAIPSGRKRGKNDGDRGEGQDSFKFGLLHIKFEIARLERWTAWQKWCNDTHPNLDTIPDLAIVDDWDERDGAEEQIARRIMDSRAAAAGHMEKDRQITLIDDFDEIGLSFEAAPGDGVRDTIEGEASINAALAFNAKEDGSYFNRPHFFLADNMVNSIFALMTYTGADGSKGAVKDWVDLYRYYFRSHCEDEKPEDYKPRGGFNYGTSRRTEPTHHIPSLPAGARRAVFVR